MYEGYVLLKDVIKILHKELPSFSNKVSSDCPREYKDIIRQSLTQDYINEITKLPTIDIVEMPNCEQCIHYNICLVYCTENTLKSRGICEHYTPKYDYSGYMRKED